MKPILYLCGAGNFEAIRLALRINEKLSRWKEIKLLDDDPTKHGQSIMGVEVAGPFALLEQADVNSTEVANLVARTTKKRLSARQKILAYGLPFAALLDPSVDVSGVEYGNDITIYQNAIFAAGAFVDEGSVVFMGAMVGHGCHIGKGCVIAPGAVVNARVQLGDGVYVGTNASILPDLKVGPWATIGTNSAVVEDVPAEATVMGVPAQIMMMQDDMKERPEMAKRSPAARSSVENTLTKIWSQVLSIEKVGRHENFFDLGGDSILAIQIISKANQAGIQLTVRQLLDNQTIAELAEVARITNVNTRDQVSATGPILLTPIQKWLLEQELPELHHYNQTMLLDVLQEIDIDFLESATGEIMKHHDALRLRFTQTEKGWQEICNDFDGAIPFSRIDLSAKSSDDLQNALRSSISEIQTSLNLSEGPIFRAVYFNLGSDQPGRLLLAIHHLAVDGISWRILLEDFQTIYMQLREGKPIKLPPKTTSYQEWAKQLTEYAKSKAILTEVDHWFAENRKNVSSIPRDFFTGANTEESTQTVMKSLTVKGTQDLLKKVPATYNTKINDILLTALTLVISKWTEESKLLVDLEGHGREEIISGVDISRTIGWFTSLFPVVLEVGKNPKLEATLKTIKEQLYKIPNNGIDYGLFRYLRDNLDLTKRLKALPQAEIQFNYLGQFDQMFAGSSMFKAALEPPGAFSRDASPLQPRPYLLEVLGMVVDEELRMMWLYSENSHKKSTIESLAEDFLNTLRTLISHSTKKKIPESTLLDFSLTNHDLQEKWLPKGGIRPFIEDDIPQVVDMHIKFFPTSAKVPADEQTAKFQELFFNSPWQDRELPSLVYEDAQRKIVGFLGVMPRPMTVKGQSLRVAVSHRFMVSPESKIPGVSIEILKKFLAGPQDLSIADEANDISREIWEGLGGATSQLYSIKWRRLLRPMGSLSSYLKKKKTMVPITIAAIPFTRLFDTVVTRLPTSPFRQSPSCDSEEDLSPKTQIQYIHQFSDENLLRPDYNDDSLKWLLDLVSRSKLYGKLKKSVVRNSAGKIIGWYIYFIKRSGVSQVLQVGASKHSAPEVLKCLYYNAWKEGAVELSGRIEPRFIEEFSRSYCYLRSGSWMLVHSRKQELIDLIQRGETILSRLDGDPWWMI